MYAILPPCIILCLPPPTLHLNSSAACGFTDMVNGYVFYL